MKKKEQRKKLGMRAVSLAALASLVLAIVLMPLEAKAVTSLSGIEQIKSRGGTFTILEIVPREGTGSIGYYVSGQEPIANWTQLLAEKTSRDARKIYADALFQNLTAREIMGAVGTDGADYPLTKTSDYQEAYPWETIPTGARELSLMAEESVVVNGTFAEAAGGGYDQTNAYEYELNGGYVENADYYVYGTSGETGTYYYALTFQKVTVTETNVASFIGVPLYTYVPETGTEAAHYVYAGTLRENSSDFTIDSDTSYYVASIVPSSELTGTWESFVQVTVTDGVFDAANGTTLYTKAADSASYQIAGTVGAEGFVPVDGTVYYRASDGAGPVNTATETVLHSYYARKNSTMPYRTAAAGETSYFKQIIGYRYVGAGNGVLSFTPGSGGSTQSVVTDTVYVSGGYVNNNWFKKYVLDMEEDALDRLRVEVKSFTPAQLTPVLLSTANLVVVSAGFDLSGGNTVPYTQDITSEQRDALAQKPRVVDGRLSGSKTNLASLGDGTAPCVTANNVYHFAAGSGNDARPALATKLFHTKFNNTAPYQVVLDEITYENQLRQVENKDLLSTDISMAACIRYILNTHRTVNKKTEIKVLDIEPAPIYDQTDNHGPLTEATVRSWLPVSANTPGSAEYIEKIDITHMSTAALIGKIEDINEEYDLIYIGADLHGLNTRNSNGKTIVDYNDNSMDGLVYTNIGDKYTADTILEGLLEKDYKVWTGGGNEIQAAKDSKTYRFSGNDITPKKKAELVEFANAGLPIVVADDLTLRTADRPEMILSVNVKVTGRTLSAEPVVKSANGTDYTGNYSYWYQWYRIDGYGYEQSSGTASSISVNAGYRYYCQVTAVSASGDSYTARSEMIIVKNGLFWEKAISGSSDRTGYSLDLVPNGATLTATLSGNTSEYSVEYQWYRWDNWYGQWVSISGATGPSYTVAAVSDRYTHYCCQVTLSKWYWDHGWKTDRFYVTSPTYKWSWGITTENDDTGKYDATIPAVTGSDGLNTARLDKCSLLYLALNSVWVKDNVLSEGELTSGTAMADTQEMLVKHLNLSRPEINLTSAPAEYDNISDLSGICNGTLSFTFTITNPTDATPSETKYTCKLYIDQNGDGRHTADEEVGDLWISSGTENGRLSAGTEYTVMRTLSRSQFSGIVPWKLQVVKVGDDTVHASQKGYTYIRPDDPTPINILQIRLKGVNLATEENFKAHEGRSRYTDNSYGVNEYNRDKEILELYKDLYDRGAYDLNVYSMTVDELNGYAPTQEEIYQYLNNFDMLVIGFGDCYGDFDKKTANAVVDYIDTGKAILFTHDTTSFRNLPKGTKYWENVNPYYESNGRSQTHWGYYFNTILRDKVGLDRYGVTNTTYGLTKYFGLTKYDGTSGTVTGPVAKGYDGASAEKLAEIKAAGYSIAYEPGSNFSPADETQGYTKYTLTRFRDNSSSLLPTNTGNYPENGTGVDTQTVSRVNQGQITQFPFTLGEELTIAWTHDQYYQLNMNSDDIVVWYCLGGDKYYSNGKNDVTNGYYIYNRGNVTYSGAGHFARDSGTLGTTEAKLFINTMVAAYRAGNGNPTVNYLTSDGSSDLSVQLIPVEYSSSANSNTTSLSGNQTVYFKITDPNLTTQKTMTVDFFYEADDGAADAALDNAVVKPAACGTIYRASDGVEVGKNALRSNVLYQTNIPQAVLNAFDASGLSEMKLYIKTTTTISGNAYTGYDVLTMKKLGLLRLE